MSMRKVYTLEDKRIGMIERDQFKILYSVQARTLTNEEFRIPISAISAVESHGSATVVKLSLKGEQLRHGYEFTKSKPNS
ncbi:MAG TPA: hypothetical protein VGJ42_03415 [Nitrososphaera sp.]